MSVPRMTDIQAQKLHVGAHLTTHPDENIDHWGAPFTFLKFERGSMNIILVKNRKGKVIKFYCSRFLSVTHSPPPIDKIIRIWT